MYSVVTPAYKYNLIHVAIVSAGAREKGRLAPYENITPGSHRDDPLPVVRFHTLMGTACFVFLLYRTKTGFCVWLVDKMAVGRLQLFSITVSGQLPSDDLYCGSDL